MVKRVTSLALCLASFPHATYGFTHSQLTSPQRLTIEENIRLTAKSSPQFVSRPQHRLTTTTNSRQNPALSTILSPLKLSSSPFVDATTDDAVQQVDANGKVFSPGTTVAISSGGMKAYQVPKAAYGTFDESTREFVPQDENNVTRGTSCLVLPEGLRGEVLRVYDVNTWDRAHPILVKFTEGADRDGDGVFSVPKTFMMHFDAFEIAVVE